MRYLTLLLIISFTNFYCQNNVRKKASLDAPTEDSIYAFVPVPPPPIGKIEEDTIDLKDVATVFDTPPQYKGGFDAFLKFTGQNLKSPNFPRMLEGTVYMAFIIEIDGSITNLRVKRGIGGGWNEAATRLLQKTSGNWECGFKDGKAVRSAYVVPVKCKME
jgi:periplasmic protein TonB